MSVKTMICALIVGLTLTGTCAHASPMLERTNGNITGVTGLVVDGDIWNAFFNDGSFDTVNATTPLIVSESFAQAAATALYDFLDTLVPGVDYVPSDFVGCGQVDACALATPDGTDIGGNVTARVIAVLSNDPPANIVGYYDPTLDFDTISNVSWVATAVPEPPLILLMASGLIVLRVTRRKRRA